MTQSPPFVISTLVSIRERYCARLRVGRLFSRFFIWAKEFFLCSAKKSIFLLNILSPIEISSQKRKEKGRVELERVHTVEAAQSFFTNEEVGIEGDFHPFLVGYHQDEDYTLFLLALNNVDRIYWILDIRRGKRP